jgi:para-aminobenzoate synthetase component II
MILVIDNYDSFTYNLVQYLGELNQAVEVRRNDAITLDEIAALAPDHLLLSPGPCTPNEAGICLGLIERFAGQIPIFGVCLGHQSIGQAFGGNVVRAQKVMHGKTSTMTHNGTGVLHGLPDPFTAIRYHSLVIEKATCPDCLEITATSEDGEIMAVRHREFNVHGVQFHPESVLTEHGHQMLRNFLAGR